MRRQLLWCLLLQPRPARRASANRGPSLVVSGVRVGLAGVQRRRGPLGHLQSRTWCPVFVEMKAEGASKGERGPVDVVVETPDADDI